MKRVLLVLFCILAFPVVASHIVGGEFEIIHLSGYTYRINLILYFDLKNGNPGANDADVTARIFRVRDNAIMSDVFLPRVSQTHVDYTQPECSNGEIVTDKIVYSTTVVLSPERYNDPQGYYIAWERCCRNYSITNIKSQNPDVSPFYAGQTFYLEFPPVIKDNVQFVNSSPRLFPPLNDYACPRKPYYVDFAGVDDDGDSLVYSLVTPLNTISADAVPPNGPRPRPYPDVSWQPPFSLDNIMGGSPKLAISQDGFVTVTPQFQGLYVFAVKCEEFREGVKIGEVRRDFQMLVVDVCPAAEPPQILGKKLTDANFTFDENMSVTFSNTVTNDDRCIQVQVSDPDASKQDDNFTERVSIRAIPLGFKQDVSGLLPATTKAVLNNGSTVAFDICFPDCPFVNGPYEIGIVAYDDACSLPLSDTLRVTVNIQPPDNLLPYFTTPDVTSAIAEGSAAVTYPIQVKDDDGNPLAMGLIPVGFNLQDVGMTFSITHQQDGQIDAQLVWDPLCSVYDFTKQTDFQIKVFAEDVDYCNFSQPVFMTLNLHIDLPPNADPIIFSDLTPDHNVRALTGYTRKVYETFTFNVFGEDADNDYLVLDVKGVGFNIQNYDVGFAPDAGDGSVSSLFYWNIGCDKVNLDEKDIYTFQFIVTDKDNRCHFVNADTLDVTVQLFPADNEQPVLTVNSLNPLHPMIAGTITSHIGETITLGLAGDDADIDPTDVVRIELIDVVGVPAEGYIFEQAEGPGHAETTFSWNPECNIFSNGVNENQFAFTFRVIDNRCGDNKGDTVRVDMIIIDVDAGEAEFVPPNFISPNGDDKNEFFAMVKFDTELNDFVSILPKDNCAGRFEDIRIYNRWGRQVYASNSRDFRWYPDGLPSGIYYYFLRYSNKEYKGSVTVRF